jgi:phosphoribosylformylglycinamidine synthase
VKAAVITFPGSNCDDDVVYTLRELAKFEVTSLWHHDRPALGEYQLVVVPGGFSYGDYLRSGAMAALSPVMEKVKEYAGNGGKVLGICNGFQILCESRLLPGALVKNQGSKFLCQDVYLKVESTESPWTNQMKVGEVVQYPIAHGDGRYVCEIEAKSVSDVDGVLLTYCDAKGKNTPESNPNGSQLAIAGIANQQRNVFGLMPHPERATDLRSQHGKKLWSSILSSLQGGNA